ncbi:phospholipid scramblase 2-like isoform X1 [Brachionus plicatilis]|uniref:Phospholipid scramblase n=1 Tax=Brachionus plicatilis TaxID=10195 RepID=A0A3M7REF9_BRAPC|nr:phospholipid scramblase 2-like isoform X1 [Brachionus plicatilis]
MNFSQITQEPDSAWMQRPNQVPGCPPGLEYLTQLDKIKVEQLVSLTEAFMGFEKNNKYVLRNANDDQFLYAYEDTDTWMRNCCTNQRGFTFYVIDNMKQEVMMITREFKCCAGCSWFASCCGAFEVRVEAPPGNLIGSIRQKGSFWKASYDILDETENVILKIEGPCCIWDGACSPCDNEFQLLTADGMNQVGSLTKEYSGFVKEMATISDKFTISFPNDLSVKSKGTLIGALLLIDFMYFEQRPNSNSNTDSN